MHDVDNAWILSSTEIREVNSAENRRKNADREEVKSRHLGLDAEEGLPHETQGAEGPRSGAIHLASGIPLASGNEWQCSYEKPHDT
jgi:hypothetical protein